MLRRIAAAPTNSVVLIDGPSGAGKSTLADAVRRDWPTTRAPSLVRLDDIYPGWQGLQAAITHLRTQVLVPRSLGLPAAWQRFDWATEQPAEWTSVDRDRPLIVEGCGSLFAGAEALSDVRVWLDADDALRKHRALTRDGELFRAHWDQWQSDWAEYCLREVPQSRATIRLKAR